MNALTELQGQLQRLTVEELAALPPERKRQIQGHLAEAAQWLKSAQDRFAQALEIAYADRGRQCLRETGHDFGCAQWHDGDVVVRFELPKKVKWDQDRLRELAERIVASGEKADHYIDAKLSVPELRWKAWPPTLQAQFAAARTVEPGKPVIALGALVEVR